MSGFCRKVSFPQGNKNRWRNKSTIKMKNLFPKILLGLLGVALVSCDDEIDKPLSAQQISIQFNHEQESIPENDGLGLTVSLLLNNPALTNGEVTLKIKDNAWQRLQTMPAHTDGVLKLPVAKGVRQLQFTVKPIDNNSVDGNLEAQISIEPSVAFLPGERNTFVITIQDDDSPASVQSVANFMQHSETMSESNSDVIEYKISLSQAVTTDSKIIIDVNTVATDRFVTNPQTENGKITLLAAAGTTELTFTLNALNNVVLTGHTEIVFSIHATEGAIVKGTQLSQKLTINDDELVGKLKSYETTAESGEKRTFEYDSKGRIAKVLRETLAPHNPVTTTDTYFYDEQDRVVKINKHLGRDLVYNWVNNRIERVDVFQDNVLIQYANYSYDTHGNVDGVEPFYKQQDGSFKRGIFSVHLYFTDGNIYKTLTFNDVPGSDEPVLISTRTYDNYLDVAAPVTMVEILPNLTTQKNLAGTYRIETPEQGTDLTYSLTYEFRPDGKPSKRTASAPGDTQITQYQYY
jgi:hypothetical protein